MSCIRSSWLFYNPLLRSVTVRSFASTSGGGGDSKDDDEKKTKTLSGLMSALEGVKVDGALFKQRIGFSAAAKFKKLNLQRVAKRSPEEKTLTQESNEEEDKMQQAAQEVAKVFPDQKKTQAELLEQLMRVKETQEDPENISDVLTGIRVQKEEPSKSIDRPYSNQGQVERHSHGSFDTIFSDVTLSHQRRRRETLFDHERLNIFQPLQETPEDVESTSEQRLSVWDIEAERKKKELIAETIRNGFEEMIKLTEEGKVWTYPIDNEKGLEEEQKVPFYEHVFLEDHLEGFPNIPEVMSFMELVLIGLSKNPYLTVEQKKEHIEWFRNYFENKMDVLKESTSAKS